jgi:hypothetical protein
MALIFIAGFLQAEIQLPASPNNENDRPQPGYEVPNIEINIIQEEYQSDDNKDDTPE